MRARVLVEEYELTGTLVYRTELGLDVAVRKVVSSGT